MKMYLISVILVTLMSTAATAGEDSRFHNGIETQGPHRVLVVGGDCVDCDFSDNNMAGARFVEGNFSRSNFTDAILIDAHFMDIEMDGSDFSDAELNQARFTGTSLIGANFSESQLLNAHAQRVDLSQAQMAQIQADHSVFVLSVMLQINADSASFEGANFRNCNMRNANLEDATITGARIQGTDLRGANLRNASLADTLLIDTSLRNANFDGTDLTGVRFRGVDLTGADLRRSNGLTSRSLLHACGDETTQLPDNINAQLSACTEGFALQGGSGAGFVFIMDDDARLLEIKEMDAARAAVTIAMEGVEESLRMREHSLAESHQRLAEMQAEAEAQLVIVREQFERKIGPEMTWNYTLRRSEIGEPIQIMLERLSEMEGRFPEFDEDFEIAIESLDPNDHGRLRVLTGPDHVRLTISRDLQCRPDEEPESDACEDNRRDRQN